MTTVIHTCFILQYIYYIPLHFLVLFFRASYNDLIEKHQPDAVK